MLFRDRTEVGQRLGAALQDLGQEDVVILALPRGGVPVGFEVAQALHAPLDVFVVRKLGAPGQQELAMGAIASGGVQVLNRDVVHALAISPEQIEAVAKREARELERREREYRGNRAHMDVRGRTAILVDDGLATGSTMRAAVAAVRRQGPKKVIVAVPVAERATCAELQELADETVCLYTPLDFFAVGQWYQDFSQTSDEQVRELLDRAAEQVPQRVTASAASAPPYPASQRANAQQSGQPHSSVAGGQDLPRFPTDVDIPPDRWTRFLDSFSRQHMDWLVTIEIEGPGRQLVLVRQRPLKGISCDRSEGQERAYIEIGDSPDEHFTHTIEHPTRVTFKETPAGGHEGLEIASADGSVTTIRFRVAMRPEMLDGVAA